MTDLRATIVITTKNRRDELKQALESCLQQSVKPEVLVIDDGSTDGTSKMVRQEFPNVKLFRHENSLGLIVSRNEGAKLATGCVIFSIDDDAVFTNSRIVEDTLTCFNDRRVGAVAIPYVDVNQSPTVKQSAPDSSDVWFTDRYIGTAHAVKRDIFLELGGYRECFFHQGEERDFCVRMLDAGYFVRIGHSEVIHHFESPKRDTERMDVYGRRNDVLVAWLNFPLVILPFHLLGTTIKGLLFGFRVGRPMRMLRGLFAGYRGIWTHFSERRPVKLSTYRRFRNLQIAGPLSANAFPDPQPDKQAKL